MIAKIKNKDQDWESRLKAVDQAGRLGQSGVAVVPVLIKVLEEADAGPSLKSGAARSLGKFGPAAKSAVPALVRTRYYPWLDVSDEAVEALRRIDPKTHHYDFFEVYGIDKTELDVDIGIKQLESLGPELSKDIIIAYNDLLRNPPPDDFAKGGRSERIKKLSDVGIPAVIFLAYDLRARDPETRRSVAQALGSLGPKALKAVPFLVETLKDPDPQVRKSAVRALGFIDLTATDVLMDALKDPDPEVRLVAAEALGYLGFLAKPALPLLNKAFDEAVNIQRVELGEIITNVENADRFSAGRLAYAWFQEHPIPMGCAPRERFLKQVRRTIPELPGLKGLEIHTGTSQEVCRASVGCKLFQWGEAERLLFRRIPGAQGTQWVSMSPCSVSSSPASGILPQVDSLEQIPQQVQQASPPSPPPSALSSPLPRKPPKWVGSHSGLFKLGNKRVFRGVGSCAPSHPPGAGSEFGKSNPHFEVWEAEAVACRKARELNGGFVHDVFEAIYANPGKWPNPKKKAQMVVDGLQRSLWEEGEEVINRWEDPSTGTWHAKCEVDWDSAIESARNFAESTGPGKTYALYMVRRLQTTGRDVFDKMAQPQ